jgi:hypothetical protein
MKAVFACKPKALMDSMKTSTFDDPTIKATEAEKDCIVAGLFEAIASDETILAAMTGGAGSPPESFKKTGAELVKKCVPAGETRDKLIKSVNEG